ncbi:MAG TPA: aspartate aminotransferase family protein [Terriglobales bacterium]|jgi:glutamate-1-semialdehyde 2,1-aminomutase|nr:aspartate aminotransferase family protein [Terriglobales bacterium]
MKTIDRKRLASLMEREQKKFVDERPKSKALFERGKKSLLAGVPMNWMVKWAGAFPPFVREAQGAHFYDVDGHRYVDLCLGDTGAMTGHSPFATVKAIEEQARRGITLMLPSEDSVFVAEELQKRFGLQYWQFALTATDANRFSIRLARQITGRPKILVYNWCYHGSVDETFITLQPDGSAKARRGNVGPPVDPTETTRVVEFNDLNALESALAQKDVACVLAEPALTNVGIVLPELGYHKGLRDLTRKYGSLLIIDETHTICAGPGGYTRAENLEPDMLVFGKPIGGGVPGATYGFTQNVADMISACQTLEDCDTGGIGGTLAGNALSLAAMRATLTKVLTKDAFDRMIPMAERWTGGVEKAILDFQLPWHVTRLGCRAEYLFASKHPKNGTEAHDAMDFELERFMHLYAMNRGILLTPFHNMALMSPATAPEDIDQHTKVFRDAAKELAG